MRPRYTLFAAVAILLSLAVARHVGLATAEGPPAPTVQPPEPACSDRGELKQLLSTRRWQEAQPMEGHPPPCEGLERFKQKLDRQHARWRYYRQVAPYRGCSGGGKWLTYTGVPGYIPEHESGCRWGVYNAEGSGACGPYQFIGWTSCDDSSWKDKMRHHRTATYVMRVQGIAGAWTNNW